ncbi:hypothetical protein AB1N83_006210 [Pleurotus pulmonarius]
MTIVNMRDKSSVVQETVVDRHSEIYLLSANSPIYQSNLLRSHRSLGGTKSHAAVLLAQQGQSPLTLELSICVRNYSSSRCR